MTFKKQKKHGFNCNFKPKFLNSEQENKNEEDSSEDDSDDGSVISVGNRIYFYAEVNKQSILILNKKIKRLNSEILFKSIENDVEPSPIHLHINSYGGNAQDGLLGMDIIASSKIPIHTVVEGVAASAATLISVIGHKRSIQPNSFMLIHQLSTMFWGNYSQIQDEIENCKLIMEKLTQCYQKNTKLPLKKIEEILKHDLYFDAEKCIKYGMVDYIE